MDGKGRWPGNVYVEHLWHSLKQEEACRHTYETIAQARSGLPITCTTSPKNARIRDLTTVPPTRYSTNESRCPKRHDPTRQYT